MIEIIYEPKYQEVLEVDDFFLNQETNRKNAIRRARSGKRINRFDFVSVCYARCKKCLHRTSYAEIYSGTNKISEAEMIIFCCWNCVCIYFVCAQCFIQSNMKLSKFKKFNFGRDRVLRGKLFQLHSQSNGEILDYLIKKYPNKNMIILENEFGKLTLKNGEVTIEIPDKYQEKAGFYLGRGKFSNFFYYMYDTITDENHIDTLNIRNSKIILEYYHRDIIIKNSGIFFYQMKKYGDLDDHEGPDRASWICQVHGVSSYI